MFTLKKIWNALNHAGKPWQISMAVALGMLVGFTPILSIHNIIVLIVVFIFNIHFAVFLLAVSFFGVLGLALDPLFASLGKTILTSNGLESIFTSWFNNPIGHLSYFNNTITMGSLIISLVLLFIVHKLFVILITKYRTIIAVKIKNIPILNKISFFQQEEQKEVKTFRMIGLVVLAVLIGLLSLFIVVFLDNIIKNKVELAINKSSDKIVKIGDLSTSFFSSSISLSDMEVSDKEDKGDNVAIKNITLDVDLGQLVFKKVIVDNFKIDGISFPSSEREAKKENKVTSSNVTTPSKIEKKQMGITALKSLNNIDIQKDFDKKIKAEFERYKGYYEKIKPLFNKDKESEIVKNRDDGKFIYFKLKSNLPEVLIRKGTFSILKDGIFINGSFEDFTTNQYLYKKPFTIKVDTKTTEFNKILLKGSFLEMKNKKEDIVHITVSNYELEQLVEKNLSIENTSINSIINLRIVDQNQITGSQSIKVISTDIAFPESNKYIVILNKSLIKTKGIKADVLLSGTLGNPKFRINSNLDKILKNKVKNVLNSQKDEIKKEIENKVKNKIKDKLNDKLGSKLKGILGF